MKTKRCEALLRRATTKLAPRAIVPTKGFITAPTLEQLRPTPRERHLIEVLWDWQEQSAKSHYKLGFPPGKDRNTADQRPPEQPKS